MTNFLLGGTQLPVIEARFGCLFLCFLLRNAMEFSVLGKYFCLRTVVQHYEHIDELIADFLG